MSKQTDNRPQIERFKEAARELETDQSEENFDRVLKRIAKPSPSSDRKPKRMAGSDG